jgi:putative hydrolase of the HAD superfamily
MKIFFDVDGVLIEGWHADSALHKPWDLTIERDLGVDREAFQRLFFGAPNDRSASRMLECVVGRCDLKDALADVLPRVGYEGSVDDFMGYWFRKDSRLNTAVFDLISEIRERSSTRVYVATGQEHHRARFLWETLGFRDVFDGMFHSARIGYAKSDRRFFTTINSLLAIGAEERPLFFDDQPEIARLSRDAGWDGNVFTKADDIRGHPRLRDFFP